MKPSGIGGQAVLEGVMMKNHEDYAVAVRKPNKQIVVEKKETHGIAEKYPFLGWIFIRGAVNFVESMLLGIQTLTFSAGFYEEGEEEVEPSALEKKLIAAMGEKAEAVMMGGTVAVSILLAVAIFMLLPFGIASLLGRVITSNTALTLVEGIIRIVIFIGYVLAISMMKDIRRVFMYHGAEHKSINCIENGFPLTVENVKKQSTRHKRCGTSFMLFVIILSVLFFMFIRVENIWLRMLFRILLIPVIAGVSYEWIKLAGRSESKIIETLSKPGLWLQGLTTREPDDEMIEVAIKSVEAVFDWRSFLEHYEEREISGQERTFHILTEEEAARKEQSNKLINESLSRAFDELIEESEQEERDEIGKSETFSEETAATLQEIPNVTLIEEIQEVNQKIESIENIPKVHQKIESTKKVPKVRQKTESVEKTVYSDLTEEDSSGKVISLEKRVASAKKKTVTKRPISVQEKSQTEVEEQKEPSNKKMAGEPIRPVRTEKVAIEELGTEKTTETKKTTQTKKALETNEVVVSKKNKTSQLPKGSESKTVKRTEKTSEPEKMQEAKKQERVGRIGKNETSEETRRPVVKKIAVSEKNIIPKKTESKVLPEKEEVSSKRDIAAIKASMLQQIEEEDDDDILNALDRFFTYRKEEARNQAKAKERNKQSESDEVTKQ